MFIWCERPVSSLQRAQLHILLDKILDGKTVVVSNLDCLGRNMQDIAATIRILLRVVLRSSLCGWAGWI